MIVGCLLCIATVWALWALAQGMDRLLGRPLERPVQLPTGTPPEGAEDDDPPTYTYTDETGEHEVPRGSPMYTAIRESLGSRRGR